MESAPVPSPELLSRVVQGRYLLRDSSPMKMNKNSKFSSFIDLQHMFFFEVGIGIAANTVLLLFYVLIFLLEHRLKPTELTIGHLALIHTVMLLTVSFLAVDIFGYQFWNDITCKSVIYLYRLMKGLSICVTCLLSVLQAVTLSPRGSRLAKFKQKSLHQNLCCCFFFWVLNMLLSVRFLMSTVATPNGTSQSLMLLSTSCSLLPITSLLKYTFFSLMTFEHMCCIGLMALSSVYMVILLCKHKRQSRHLHSTSLSPKASPEQRATWTILLLMTFFIILYTLDCVLGSASSISWNHDPVHHSVLMLVGNGYATVSPLVLISTERRMAKCLIFM